MLRDESNDNGEYSWATNVHGGWREVDRELRSIAKRQSGLDAELMAALREAERVRLWHHLGHVSMMSYLEHVFGYSPKVAQERLRVARKLESLPELTAALASHELPFSSVRELTRVATPATERDWRDQARGKCLREIEELVSGHAEGDLPNDPKQPDLESRTVSFELRPATYALLRQAQQRLDNERGQRLDPDELMSALCQAVLSGGDTGLGDAARYQIVRYHCETCARGQQAGGGAKLDLEPWEVELGECDAERVGSLDAPARAKQDIPPKVRRFVELRDGGRCRINGCRSTRNLALHHIVHRKDGGTHHEENVICTCDACHKAHHRGLIRISGTASALVVERVYPAASTDPLGEPDRCAHVGADPIGEPDRRAHVGAEPIGEPDRCAHVGCDQEMQVREEEQMKN